MVITEGEPIDPATARLSLLDADGHTHALSSHYEQGDALFVLVRHFGCVACHEQVDLLRARLAELAALSVNAVIVGCAAPEELAPWREREGLDRCAVTVRTDPTLAVHRALGLRRSLWATWGPGAALGFLRAIEKGALPGKFRGDVSQQAGALYAGRDGVARAVVRSEHLGDHVSIGAMIDVALAARVRESPLRV